MIEKFSDKMDYNSFNYTLDMGQPPVDFHESIKALWWERKGEWVKAHELIQNSDGPDAAWVHAYLHRKEGDTVNAGYWYARAGRDIGKGDIVEEFRTIVSELLKKYNS